MLVFSPSRRQNFESRQRNRRSRVQSLSAEQGASAVGQLHEHSRHAGVAAAPQRPGRKHAQIFAGGLIEGDRGDEIDEFVRTVLLDGREAAVHEPRVLILEGRANRAIAFGRHAQLQLNGLAPHPHIRMYRPSRRRESVGQLAEPLKEHEQVPLDEPALVSKARQNERAQIDRRVGEAVEQPASRRAVL